MNEPGSQEPDAVDEIFAPLRRDSRLSHAGNCRTAADGNRQAVFALTARVLLLRRVLRRSKWAAVLAACYVAGLVTPQFWRPAPPTADVHPVNPAANVAAMPATPLLTTDNRQLPTPPVPSAPVSSAPVPTPKQRPLVIRGTGRKPTRFEVLKAAGDREWRRKGDMLAAVRFYARALDAASPEEMVVSIDKDNWLLMSLKEARLKEKRHDKTEG